VTSLLIKVSFGIRTNRLSKVATPSTASRVASPDSVAPVGLWPSATAIVTVDDVLDVVESEATEDIHRLGAAPIDIDYARAKPWLLFRKRVQWLILLVVSMTLTFNVIAHYEEVIAEIVILAAFIPLLIGTGGNVGAQVATLVVRALATRELETRDLIKALA
jgi:magnesium transporter